MLFFFPAKIQAVVGVVLIVVGLTVLHSFIVAGARRGGRRVRRHPLRPLAAPERVPAMSAIIVEDLVKRYGRFTAVEDVSFEVASGQVTALLGPNGAGKTTTIEILEGFLAPTAGTVQVLGADPRAGGRAWRARIGLVLQTTSLDAQLTVTRGADDVRGAVPEAAPDRGGPRPHRPGRGRQDQDRGAERGPASPGRPGPGHHRPAGDAVPGRADHRPGPGSPPRGCGR